MWSVATNTAASRHRPTIQAIGGETSLDRPTRARVATARSRAPGGIVIGANGTRAPGRDPRRAALLCLPRPATSVAEEACPGTADWIAARTVGRLRCPGRRVLPGPPGGLVAPKNRFVHWLAARRRGRGRRAGDRHRPGP